MKKIRYGCLTLLCVFMMVAISACGSRDNGTGTTSSPSHSAATASESSGGMNESGQQKEKNQSGTRASDEASESTGVIDGLLDDVGNGIEEGVKDVERAVEGSDTSAAETSAGR